MQVLIHNVMQISRSEETRHAHAFSLYIMQPFVATSLGLLAFNWYPSSVFVGDTYTYFAGMALAVVGILGHFSETMLLFFLPQILNFLYSIPQLFKIVPCPRHRLPSFDPHSGLLIGSNDMNLVNLFLRWFGRCSEQQLCIRLLIFQVLCCGFCFGLRYLMAGWYKWRQFWEHDLCSRSNVRTNLLTETESEVSVKCTTRFKTLQNNIHLEQNVLLETLSTLHLPGKLCC